ncbi:probable 39S ribosomal protein L24, mitochondrial [Centruroides sculpturatus]|uniref:probable 39S ribosomal protein L24, mitochondrial n=1 Tax=Centruroides sculpturatus TaxID=218467 RepID=UPI000C6E768D|nr:probable 39S ribosomal protein L24, mitochondrial [Centruroides sculpturatus]
MKLTRLLFCASKLPKDYSNFPERYIKRCTEWIDWKPPPGPQYRQKIIKRDEDKLYYDMHRVWTDEFKRDNLPGDKRKDYLVEPVIWTMFRGDKVEILAGKDKGKQGIINYVVKERNWVCVEGLNCDYKYIGKTKNFPGVMVKDERPLLVTSEVALIDPSDEKPTKVKWRYTEDGKKVRVSVRTGYIIPLPLKAFETYDYKSKELYVDQPKDTPKEVIKEITFIPKLMTFEQEIMEDLGIKEERRPFLTYWY